MPIWHIRIGEIGVIILLGSLLRTALVAVVGTVVVQLYLHVRFFQVCSVRQAELQILDIQPSFYPHRLVVGLDIQKLSGEW